MKLASLKAGRDGRLFVVSSDLRRATDAFAVASTLQSALDDWDRISPKLADLAEALKKVPRAAYFVRSSPMRR